MDNWLSIREAAWGAKVCTKTVNRAIRSGRLKVWRRNARYVLICPESFKQWACPHVSHQNPCQNTKTHS